MAHRLTSQGKKVTLVRPKGSIRGDEKLGTLKTKNKIPWPSHDLFKPNEIRDVIDRERPDVIWVDEPGLFVTEHLKGEGEALFHAVQDARKTCMILMSGIAATSEMTFLGLSLPLLMGLADEIHHCKGECAWCAGYNNATRSLYLSDIPKDRPDVVGGVETYLPACPECWNRLAPLSGPERLALRKTHMKLDKVG